MRKSNTPIFVTLLARPKDDTKQRVVLNLSYPTGTSLNDAVTRDLFNNKALARAFRNLRVDPVDACKFGIHWKDKVYLDVAGVFGWVHGSVSFQKMSDAILHMMRDENRSTLAYIDDFVIVHTRMTQCVNFSSSLSFFMKYAFP